MVCIALRSASSWNKHSVNCMLISLCSCLLLVSKLYVASMVSVPLGPLFVFSYLFYLFNTLEILYTVCQVNWELRKYQISSKSYENVAYVLVCTLTGPLVSA